MDPSGRLLRFKADRRTLAFVIAYGLLVVTAWLMHPIEWYGVIPLVLAISAMSWFCAIITHNTVHSPVFKNRIHNKLFQIVLSLTYGHPVSSFVPGHNLSHHRFTQTPRDVMRTTKVRFRWNLLNGLLFFPSIVPAIVRGEFKFVDAMKEQRPQWYRQLVIEFILLWGLSLLLLWVDWEKFLLYFYLPHVWAAWGIITMNLLQHDGCDEKSPYNHSRNFVGKAFGWYTFNNGYHGIHHHHPGMHWSLLAQAHREEIAPHIHPNLDQASIYTYIWRTYIWPGKRLNHAGEPWTVPPQGRDENWVPTPETMPDDMSLGAET